MHLTNYAVNKHSKDFIRDEETGSKRCVCTLISILMWLANEPEISCWIIFKVMWKQVVKLLRQGVRACDFQNIVLLIPFNDITNYLILNYLFHFRRITTVNRWFTDNGYDVKEIWASIEVRNILISCRSGSWLKNKVHLCTCKLTKVSVCKHGIGSYMCWKEKLLFKWYMTFERKWWASVTLLDTWHNFILSASFICNM